MKKYIKYMFVIMMTFLLLKGSVMATTIIETTKDDDYDTILEGSMIIGVTKFDSNVVLTASRVAKAGANDAALYAKKNNGVDGYVSPIIYVYYGVGGWYELDDDNNANMVTDEELLNKLSNSKIYYVNNNEKKIDINLDGIEVDEEKLTSGVSLKDGKLLVNATLNEFKITTKNGKEVTYNFNEDKATFEVNNKVCFTTSNGYITGYSDKCISDVELPNEINGEKIIGVKTGAFDGLGITKVLINKNIMHLEDNAFANNTLSSVIIKDKYDKTDFTTYGNNVFGDFSEDKVIYDNDLTRLLKLFKDENKLKVKEGLDLNKYEIVDALLLNERNKLDIKEDVSEGLVYYIYDSRKYRINYCLGIDNYSCTNVSDDEKNNIGENEFILTISLKDNESKFVSEKISYEVERVPKNNATEEKISKTSSEIEAYLKSINEEIFKENYNVSLANFDELEKIINKNNLEYYELGLGAAECDPPLNITKNVYFNNRAGIEYMLLDEGVLVDNKFEIEFYSGLGYDFSDKEKLYDSADELFEAATKKFDEEVNLKNYEFVLSKDFRYEIKYSGPDKNGNAQFTLTTSVEDKNTSNHWYLNIIGKIKDQVIEEEKTTFINGVAIPHIQYHYYSGISYDDYASKEEFEAAVKEKFASKFNISDFSNFNESKRLLPTQSCKEIDGNKVCENIPNFDDKYQYVITFSPKNWEDEIVSYEVYIFEPLESEQ